MFVNFLDRKLWIDIKDFCQICINKIALYGLGQLRSENNLNVMVDSINLGYLDWYKVH